MSADPMIDLAAEFEAAQAAMTGAHRDRLHRLGVETWATDPRCLLIGAARVRFEGDRFEPAPDDGDAAVIVAVRGEDGPTTLDHADPIRAATMGEAVLDLLAFTTTRPERWALRVGAVDQIGYMPIQEMRSSDPTDGAAWFWPTPLAWLADGCGGLCILTDDPAKIRSIVTSARRPFADDAALAARLRAIAARPMPVPAFAVMSRAEFFDATLGIAPAARAAA
jgi:hypothetical protein